MSPASDGKVAVIVRIRCRPGCRETVVDAYSSLFEAVDDEPGTEIYALHAATEDPDVLYFYELYSNTESLARHAGGRHLAAVAEAVADKLDDVEIILTHPLSAKGLDIGAGRADSRAANRHR